MCTGVIISDWPASQELRPSLLRAVDDAAKHLLKQKAGLWGQVKHWRAPHPAAT
jgi:hypothetical protein